jgi:hypothetical protein
VYEVEYMWLLHDLQVHGIVFALKSHRDVLVSTPCKALPVRL